MPYTTLRMYSYMIMHLIYFYFQRLTYGHELNRYINVDIFGKCGNDYVCSKKRKDACITEITKQYKFYLAFENSNCREYITEKLYRNAYE